MHSIFLRCSSKWVSVLFFCITANYTFAVEGILIAKVVIEKPSVDEPETVYVSATRSETSAMPIATQIKVISHEDIQQSGAKLLAEVLRTQAGLQLTDSDGSGARNVTAAMRGLSGANNVLVLVDGRKLNNPSLAGPSLNTIALKDVERIEIVQGSAGVLYGDQAVGGVINIVTRRATVGKINGSLNATAGTDNLEDYTASVTQGFENGLSYRVSAQKRLADNYRANNQNTYENLLGKLRYDSELGYGFIEKQTVDDQLRLAGALTEQQVRENPRQTTRPNDFNNQTVDILHVGGGIYFTEQWQFHSELSDRDEAGNYFNFSAADYELRVKTFTPRVTGQFATTKGSSVLTLGYDRIESHYISNNVFSALDTHQRQEAIYTQWIHPLLSNLTATVGARVAQVNDDNQILFKENVDELTAKELGLNYQFTHDWRLFWRYAESFRFANADENSLVASTVDFLKPQEGDSLELGTQWLRDKGQISVSLYHLELKDEIVYDPFVLLNNQFYDGANINLPDSERQGLIIDTNWQVVTMLNLRANYTYTDAIVAAGNYQGKEVPFVSRNTGNLVLVFTPWNALVLSCEISYRGSRYKADDEANADVRLKPLTVTNFSVGYDYDVLNISARVKNITNEKYAGLHSIYGVYPQPERNYEVGLSTKF